MVVSLDATLSLVAITTLLLSEFEPIDTLLLMLHLPHLLTIAIAYVSVHFSSAAADVLRMLVLFYLIALVADIAVAVARCAFLIHAQERLFFAELVRLALALAFACTDLAGAIFADFARTSMHTFDLVTNQHLLAFAAHRFNTAPKVTPANAKSPPLPV